MKTITLLVTIGLLALAISGTKLRKPSSDFPELKKAEKSNWGKQLLDTIALQMRSKANPLPQIKSLLNDIRDSLNAEQTQEDEQHAADMAYFADEIDRLQGIINDSQAEILAASTKIDDLHIRIHLDNDAITSLDASIAKTEDEISRVEQARVDDKQEFERRQSEHEALISALTDSLHEISKLDNQAEPALIQKVTKKLAKIGSSNPILAFAEIASTADKATVQKLMNLFKRLIGSVSDSLSKDQDSETTSETTYVSLIQKLRNILADLTQKLNDAQKDLEESEAELAHQEEIHRENTEINENANEQLTTTVALRRTKDDLYNSNTAGRTEELEIIAEILGFLSERFDDMSDYLRGRLDSGEFEAQTLGDETSEGTTEEDDNAGNGAGETNGNTAQSDIIVGGDEVLNPTYHDVGDNGYSKEVISEPESGSLNEGVNDSTSGF